MNLALEVRKITIVIEIILLFLAKVDVRPIIDEKENRFIM